MTNKENHKVEKGGRQRSSFILKDGRNPLENILYSSNLKTSLNPYSRIEKPVLEASVSKVNPEVKDTKKVNSI
jgi:hypothetical protein